MSSVESSCIECGCPLPSNSPTRLCLDCLMGGAESRVASGVGLFEFPGHEVLKEIARGGMGIVYLAREQSTQRIVALKMLLPRLADDPSMRARFRMEATAAASFDHEAILPVYCVGECEGIPYFTMKLASGGSLAERRESMAGKWRDIAALMVTLSSAVQHAHQRGMLHRDIKPGNILFDEEGRAWLSDFGLVKMMDAPSNLTLPQDFLGTAHYCAPEVASANAGAASVASDVWSLGTVLYELLTGRLPFDAPSLVALLRKIEEEPPASVTAADAVPTDLRIIALKCLEKNQQQRYESAAALEEDLQAWLSGRPIKARSVTPLRRAVAWSRRNPVLAILAFTLLISVVFSLNLLRRTYVDRGTAAEQALQGQSAARAAEAEAIIKEIQSRMADGRWVDRSKALAALQRSYQLKPSPAARDAMLSLFALPDLEQIGAVPYDGGRPVFFNGDLSRYVTRSGKFTTLRDSNTHKQIYAIPEIGYTNFPVGPLSADGKDLYLRTKNGVDIWHLPNATRIGSLRAGARSAGFSRDGGITAAGVDILDLRVSPATVRSIQSADCQALAISADGSRILLAQPNRLRVQLADSRDGRILQDRELLGKAMMHCATWSSDGKFLVSGSTDGRVIRWDAETLVPESILPLHTDGVDDIALFYQDQHLITQGRDSLTKIWDISSESCVATFPWGGLRVEASTDGTKLAIDCLPQRKSLLMRYSPPPICHLTRLPASYVPNSYFQGNATVLPANDGNSFAVTAGHDLHLMDREGKINRTFLCGRCLSIVKDPSGNYLRVSHLTDKYQLIRIPDGSIDSEQSSTHSLTITERPVGLVTDHSKERYIACVRNRLAVIDVKLGKLLPFASSATAQASTITAVAISPCGSYLSWASENRGVCHLQVMDLRSEKILHRIKSERVAYSICFTADGRRLLVGDQLQIRCIDLHTEQVIWAHDHTRTQHYGTKTPIAISVAARDGTIAVALDLSSVSILNGRDGSIRYTLRHPQGKILNAIGISPDGQRLVTLSSYLVTTWKLDAATSLVNEYKMDASLSN